MDFGSIFSPGQKSWNRRSRNLLLLLIKVPHNYPWAKYRRKLKKKVNKNDIFLFEKKVVPRKSLFFLSSNRIIGIWFWQKCELSFNFFLSPCNFHPLYELEVTPTSTQKIAHSNQCLTFFFLDIKFAIYLSSYSKLAWFQCWFWPTPKPNLPR